MTTLISMILIGTGLIVLVPCGGIYLLTKYRTEASYVAKTPALTTLALAAIVLGLVGCYAPIKLWAYVASVVAYVVIAFVVIKLSYREDKKRFNTVGKRLGIGSVLVTVVFSAASLSLTDTATTAVSMSTAMPQHFNGKTVEVKQADGQIRLAAQPTGTGQGDEEEQWRQYLVANPKSNFVLEGLLTQQQVATLPEDKQLLMAKEAFLVHAKKNVFLLTTSAKNGGFYDGNVNDIGKFVTPVNGQGEQYLSDEGRSLYATVAACANTPGALSFRNVSSNSINTGFSEGGVSESQGITGNLKALVITCEQKGVKHQMKILVRCGNNVFEVSVAPQGHTDEQTPRPQGQGGGPPPSTTTPSTTTPSTTTPGKVPTKDPCRNGNDKDGQPCPSATITASSSPSGPGASTETMPSSVPSTLESPTATTVPRATQPGTNEGPVPTAPATGDPGTSGSCTVCGPTTQSPQATGGSGNPAATGASGGTEGQATAGAAESPAATTAAQPSTTTTIVPSAWSRPLDDSPSWVITLASGFALLGLLGMCVAAARVSRK